MLTAEQIREILKMKPHPIEGGYFSETYRSAESIPQEALPAAFDEGPRSLATAIFYLLTPETFSAMHRLRGDEMFHFYLGDPVEMLQLSPDGQGELILLGQNIGAGMRLQHLVPGESWQGCRLCAGGKYALMGTTMAPGFDAHDYDIGKREELNAQYPNYASFISMLTRA